MITQNWYSSISFHLLSLLHFALPHVLLIQVLDELLALHPVDLGARVTAVAKERSAGEVHQTSCRGTTDRWG